MYQSGLSQISANLDWNVDGLDPVPWPGKDYQLLSDTPGFTQPALAAALLNANGSDARWTQDSKSGSSVENIYCLERENSPWQIRARLGGSGAHPDADFVEYVLDLKCLVGAPESGNYQEREIARGTLAHMQQTFGNIYQSVEAAFPQSCADKTKYRLVPSLQELTGILQQMRGNQ